MCIINTSIQLPFGHQDMVKSVIIIYELEIMSPDTADAPSYTFKPLMLHDTISIHKPVTGSL